MPVIAVQTVVSPHDVPVANSTYLVLRQLGPVIFVAVAQAIFLNKLLPEMQAINPALTKTEIVQAGATGLKALVRESDIPRVLVACVKGFDAIFMLASVLAGISAVVALGVEWKSIKKEKLQQPFVES